MHIRTCVYYIERQSTSLVLFSREAMWLPPTQRNLSVCIQGDNTGSALQSNGCQYHTCLPAASQFRPLPNMDVTRQSVLTSSPSAKVKIATVLSDNYSYYTECHILAPQVYQNAGTLSPKFWVILKFWCWIISGWSTAADHNWGGNIKPFWWFKQQLETVWIR